MSKSSKPKQPSRVFGIIASVISVIMGLSHFAVPFVFPWESLINGLYPPIQWALFAMNFFFSLLLLWGGLLTLAAALKWQINARMRVWIFGGMGLFWCIGAVYEIIFPFPMKEAAPVLPAIAFVEALLYWLYILFNNNNKVKSSTQKQAPVK